jgi:hypothetical protein
VLLCGSMCCEMMSPLVSQQTNCWQPVTGPLHLDPTWYDTVKGDLGLVGASSLTAPAPQTMIWEVR